jgi:hypothetical protein
MRRLVALALVALAGVSCSAAVRWQKTGVAAAEQQRDETDCTARANREGTVSTASTMAGSPAGSVTVASGVCHKISISG